MSQITSASIGGIIPPAIVTTLTGNSGGAVSPTGNNINVVGDTTTVNIVGNPGTSTLTVSTSGAVSNSFPTDSGTATPALGALTVAGGELLGTTGAGSTVTVNLDRGTNGQVIIAATGAPSAYATITSTGGSISFTPGANTLNMEASATTPLSFPTDAGTATPAANALTIHGTHNINTSGAGAIVTVANNNTATFGDLSPVGVNTASLTLTSGDLLISGTGGGGNINFPATTGANVGVIEQNGTAFIHSLGTSNAFLGANAGGFGVNAPNNVGIGTSALASQGGGFGGNTMVGAGSGSLITAGDSNTGLGASTLATLNLGQYNEAIGYLAGRFMPSGDNNTMIGYRAGELYVGSEDSNILIRNFGVAAETHTMRLGTSGSSDGQVNRAFIAGVNGVNVGSVASVVTNSGDQLGTATITAGTNVTVTPGANTITIAANAAGQTAMYREVLFAASPYTADTLSPDYYISADTAGGAITIRLPNAPSTGRVYVVKDQTGNAAAVNITVTTVGGAVLLDGSTSYVINTAYQAAQFIFGGSAYEVF